MLNPDKVVLNVPDPAVSVINRIPSQCTKLIPSLVSVEAIGSEWACKPTISAKIVRVTSF